ncbi:hypothetical protein BSL78_26999 [Apostichopus japonicus]|uniref:Uncharacterized protein n=1 Tax=Stichopus japonicus TaxID=307972 RepID=A0A2G8JKB9_STIJA|nr:hypothetical protein BSL78_26999 [Apostichopus japonicus]
MMENVRYIHNRIIEAIITVKTHKRVLSVKRNSANDWLNTIGPKRLPINMRPLFYFLVVCLQAAEGLQEQDYIFSFLYNYGSSNYGLELYIASTSTNRQTVGNIFLPRSDVTIPFNIEPMSGELIQLPWAAQPSRSSYQSSTVYVQADQHIYIYGFSSDYGSSESFYPYL